MNNKQIFSLGILAGLTVIYVAEVISIKFKTQKLNAKIDSWNEIEALGQKTLNANEEDFDTLVDEFRKKIEAHDAKF
jgi:hypothetical protein